MDSQNTQKSPVETFHAASSRHTLSFEEYALQLTETLSGPRAPKVLIDGLRRMEEVIMYNRAYTAPEALNDAADKMRMFEAFCELEPMALCKDLYAKTAWRKSIVQFLEDNC